MMKNAKKETGDQKEDNILALEQKIGELTASLQRIQADFMNFKRQADADRQRLIKMANENLILDILPVLDNFQLAAKHIPKELENDNWTAGIKQIEKQLESVLQNEGLERIATIGTHFDPQYHEAVEHIKSDEPENTVVEEISAGYKLNEKVIRPSKVKVSNGNRQ